MVDSTFCVQDGDLLVVDPDSTEEAAAAGLMTVVVNTHSDICTVRKTSGIGISMTQARSNSERSSHLRRFQPL